ncbi:hypothetical protein RI578_21405 [Streptomyces sp. BB1-1-1]|uniref:hypothetical protein n=1 Tax=Streptomyces sp. BB1-1-1 TaxID=3074430 RepID=UPI002877F8BF|nr:hypothetical protein [Streptomyces sp. BB1-1-1]WND36679.1 hypothetical protein RI578_21405 [Streptomyces sp. BB1-1-1]
MHDLIHRIAHWLGLLFGPGTGTHRAGSAPRPRILPSTAPARLPLHHSPYCRHLPLDGTDSRLVRPYLAADFGIDLDQHVVGARKAAA